MSDTGMTAPQLALILLLSTETIRNRALSIYRANRRRYRRGHRMRITLEMALIMAILDVAEREYGMQGVHQDDLEFLYNAIGDGFLRPSARNGRNNRGNFPGDGNDGGAGGIAAAN